MASVEKANNPAQSPRPVDPLKPWARQLAIATAVVFCISTVFPVAAAIVAGMPDVPRNIPEPPGALYDLSMRLRDIQFWGVLDVVLAFVLVFMAITLTVITEGRVTESAEKATYRVYRNLAHGILIVLAIFFLAGDRIAWSIGLVGIAWRTWLLLYTLPAWITAVRSPTRAE